MAPPVHLIAESTEVITKWPARHGFLPPTQATIANQPDYFSGRGGNKMLSAIIPALNKAKASASIIDFSLLAAAKSCRFILFAGGL
jgi:hypothetical protein